ncbi:class I SAM-dependent methyltransferase [Streptomyces sp. NPDC059255]|uniref:class I SAM-dependent methyltransferase n=1 Tax=Streptomyces sp. NPDC059255 TaxID=3346793 RepID=UPI0036C6AC75
MLTADVPSGSRWWRSPRLHRAACGTGATHPRRGVRDTPETHPGALVDAVDASPSQHQRATERYGRQPGLNLFLSDAVEHLRQAEPYDVIYSIHGVAYIDPRRLLPALGAALRPGGRLVLSVLHTNSEGLGPSTTVVSRPEILPLAGGGRLTVPHVGAHAVPLGRPVRRTRPRCRPHGNSGSPRGRQSRCLHSLPGAPPFPGNQPSARRQSA